MKKIHDADVVIIGGGAVGCSTAYHLAKKGKRVVLCEMNNIASGATGRCGGMVIHAYGRDFNIDKIGFRLMCTKANTELMKDYQKSFEINFEFRQIGSLDIAVNEKEYEHLKDLIKIQHSLGDYEIELLDKKQTLEIIPNINSKIVFGSRFRKSDGNLNPFLLARSLCAEAQKLDVEIMCQKKVKQIITINDKVHGVLLENNLVIECESVVNATNAWASILSPETEIIPVRGIAMLTERMPILPAQPFEIYCLGDFVYGCTQTVSGNYNLGGAGPPEGPDFNYYDENIYSYEVLRVMSFITEIFPSLKNISLIRSWAGALAFSPDGLPSIGPMPNIKGLFIAAGFPEGMSWAVVSGKLIAEFIIKGKTSLPIDRLNPGRFIKKPKIVWPQPYDMTFLHDFLTQGDKN